MSENALRQKMLGLLLNIKRSIDDFLAEHGLKPPQVKTVSELISYIPEDLRELITVDEGKDYFLVKPKGYLGTENFAKMINAVRFMGGEYISAGKDSHFKVPKAS
ncbi:MAG: hypothetical protein QXR89_08820 [Candidatus Bathyarchaeia archaeon]